MGPAPGVQVRHPRVLSRHLAYRSVPQLLASHTSIGSGSRHTPDTAPRASRYSFTPSSAWPLEVGQAHRTTSSEVTLLIGGSGRVHGHVKSGALGSVPCSSLPATLPLHCVACEQQNGKKNSDLGKPHYLPGLQEDRRTWARWYRKDPAKP